MNIAIFTPNKNPYSETFIQAHKNHLAGNIFYYYGNTWAGITLEQGNQKFNQLTVAQKLKLKLSGGSVTQMQQQNLIDSLLSNKIDVALVEYGHHAHWLLPVLKGAKIPFAAHFHGHDATEHHILNNTQNYTKMFAAAARVIAVSRFMENHLHQLGCPKEKLVYNVYGPRPEFAEDVSPNFKKQTLLSVGRFTNKKAPYYTLLAFSKIANDFPEAELIFAGVGVLFEACRNTAVQLGLQSRVRFMGIATADQLKEELTNARAYVQHSITTDSGDMEGTPLSILEASSAGLPVISTFHAGIPDVIADGETGLLCKEHDVQTMSEHMAAVLADASLAKKLGDAGKKRIAEQFSLTRHISALNDILEQARNA